MDYRLAISTMSLGRAWNHRLLPKLEAAAHSGYEGIELFFEDLEYHAREFFHGTDAKELLRAANDIKKICAQLHLQIICLQPLMHYEGLRYRSDRIAAMKRAELWFRIAKTLETSIVAVPSNFLDPSQTVGDRDTIVRDFQQLADIAVTYQVKLVYEALCWGTHVDRWEQSWDITKAVDRPNFGICLDTFNIAGRIFADPTSPSRMTQDADVAVETSLQNMSSVMDVKKIFYIQVVDAERLAAPLDESHEFHNCAQPPRMSWSRNSRLFYGEKDKGGYLPILRIMETIVHKLGYRGWISMELFNRSMENPSPLTPVQHAERGSIAWEKLLKDLRLQPECLPTDMLNKDNAEHHTRALL